MSYQANLDIVIVLNSLHVKAFHKQGTLRFKISLQVDPKTKHSNVNVIVTQGQLLSCPPYNIYQLPRNPKDKYWHSQGVRPLVGMVPGPNK